MYETTQDKEYLAKHFNGVNAEIIFNEALLRLGIHILATEYLEKRALWFIKVIKDNKEINEKAKTVSNLKEEVKTTWVFYKEKKDAWGLLLTAACASAPLSTFIPEFLALSASGFPVLGFFAPPLAFMSTVPMPGSSTPSSAALIPVHVLSSFPSQFVVPVPALSTPPFLSIVLMPRLFAPLFLSAMLMFEWYATPSLFFMLVPGSSALPSPFVVPMPYRPLFPIWFSSQTPTLVLGGQRVSKWGRIIEKTFTKEATLTFTTLFSERLSPPFFLSSSISEK